MRVAAKSLPSFGGRSDEMFLIDALLRAAIEFPRKSQPSAPDGITPARRTQ
jgi:hypothetical protein